MDSFLTYNSVEFENLELYTNLEKISHNISKYLILAKTASKNTCVIHQHCVGVYISKRGIVKQRGEKARPEDLLHPD